MKWSTKTTNDYYRLLQAALRVKQEIILGNVNMKNEQLRQLKFPNERFPLLSIAKTYIISR